MEKASSMPAIWGRIMILTSRLSLKARNIGRIISWASSTSCRKPDAGSGDSTVFSAAIFRSARGMSSSAAIEAGLAFALNHLFGLDLDPLALVKLAQKAENEFVGVRCGIMDQFINIFGRPKSVLKLDCRSLEFQYYPFEREDLRIVLCDTLIKRELAASEYNVRRQQCEAGVSLLAKYDPSVRSLRDVSPALLEAHRAEFDPIDLQAVRLCRPGKCARRGGLRRP